MSHLIEPQNQDASSLATLLPNKNAVKVAAFKLPLAAAYFAISVAASHAGIVPNSSFTNPANSHTYLLLEKDTWSATRAEAVSLGGDLATINDAAENLWVVNTFSATERFGAWIGLSYVTSEGDFTWSNGESASYRNWSIGEPNNVAEFGLSGDLRGEIYLSTAFGLGNERIGKWNDYLGSLPGLEQRFGLVEITVPEPSLAALIGIGASYSLLASRRF